MALPKGVQDAVSRVDRSLREWRICQSPWQTIRAHLLSQAAEIERLQSRLAAADALLREAIEWNWLDEDSPAVSGVNKDIPSAMDAIYIAIKSHLQGAGDEA